MPWNCAGVPCGSEGDIQDSYADVGKPKVLLGMSQGFSLGWTRRVFILLEVDM